MKKVLAPGLILSMLWQQTAPSWAADNDAFQFFQEEAKVTTASRREQPISESPVAIDVITTEDIKASGAVHLWDLLRYQPGVNVIDGNTARSDNRAVVAIRGFAERFTRNLLVLVDGRTSYSSVTGGVFWDELPVQINDIDRIEIIRGPNAALYGSGAGLGVINIITKKPVRQTSLALDERGGNRNTIQSYESVNSSLKDVSFQLSHTYNQQGGFDSTSGGVANNFIRGNKANVRSHWNPSEASELELLAGGSWDTAGTPNALNSQNPFSQHFEMLKFEQKFSEASRVQLLSSRNDFTTDNNPSVRGDLGRLASYQYDEQILHQIDWAGDRMKSTYGFDYQQTHADSQAEFGINSGAEIQVYRGYFNQMARLTPHIEWVGAFSWEATDTGAPHPNYQISHLWEPVEDQSFRVSYSVAHTIPTLRLLDLNSVNGAGAPNFGNPTLNPQTLTSYETGYRGNWLNRHLEVESNLFYILIDGIDDTVPLAPGSDATTFGNINQAIARGAEMQLKYRFDRKYSLYTNYTYEHITDIEGNSGEVTKNTPEHAVNFGAIADLGNGFSGSFNVGYKDRYFITVQDDLAVHAYWRLDARLAYALPWYKDAEVYIAGQNLTTSTHEEYADGLTIPRTYQGGVSIKFGGVK
jgi:iron complex outermembrane recepter protein